MKKIIVLLFLIPVFATAQVTTHTVGQKETLYSLARQYNIHPRELAEYNNISVQSNLTIGQVIKIPATRKMAPLPPIAGQEKKEIVKDALPQKREPIKPVGSIIKDPETKKPIGITETIAPVTGGTPVYHKVEQKETLYHISTLYNKVPVADIKKWNNLTSDDVSVGTDLIVGYTKNSTPVAVAEIKPMAAPKDLPRKETPVEQMTQKETPKEIPVVNNVTDRNFNGGYFKNLYKEKATQQREEKGQGGIFKSTSGWEDGKYYCLNNTIPAGSIVKITSTTTNKSVYAKVLDIMPDLKQNNDLVLRLSNAAADQLGVGADNFECTIQY